MLFYCYSLCHYTPIHARSSNIPPSFHPPSVTEVLITGHPTPLPRHDNRSRLVIKEEVYHRMHTGMAFNRSGGVILVGPNTNGVIVTTHPLWFTNGNKQIQLRIGALSRVKVLPFRIKEQSPKGRLRFPDITTPWRGYTFKLSSVDSLRDVLYS